MKTLVLSFLLWAGPLFGAEANCVSTAYKVERGDTLSQIAEEAFGSWRRYDWIVIANPKIVDPNLIYAGDVLTIPCSQIIQVSAVKEFTPPSVPVHSDEPEFTLEPVPDQRSAQITVNGFVYEAVLKTREIAPEPFVPIVEVQNGPTTQSLLPRDSNALIAPTAEQNNPPKFKQHRSVGMRILKSPTWPFTHKRKTLGLLVIAMGMTPQTKLAAMPAGIVLAALTPSPKVFALDAAPVSTPDGTPPSRETLVTAGQRPQLRYTVPDGDVKWVPVSIYSQGAYSDKSKSSIEQLPRDLASSLGLSGTLVWNEWPGSGTAVQVALADNAVIIYTLDQQRRPTPLYLADCRYNNKMWANRLKLVSAPPSVKLEQQQTVAQGQPATAYANATAPAMSFNMPQWPNPWGINFTGLPQQPTEMKITHHNINETIGPKQTKAQAFNLYATGIMKVGVAVAAETAAIKFPNAWKTASFEKTKQVRYQTDASMVNEGVKANAAITVANIQAESAKVIAGIDGQSRVDAAAALRPTQINMPITTTGVTGTTVSPNISANPTNTVTSTPSNINITNPTNIATPSNSVVAHAEGGQGGQGGLGGQGGSGGSGGSAPPIVFTPTIQGSTSNSDASSASTNGGVTNSGNNAGNSSATGNGGNVTGSGNSTANGGNVSGSGNSTANGGQATANGGQANATGGQGGNANASGGTSSSNSGATNTNANTNANTNQNTNTNTNSNTNQNTNTNSNSNQNTNNNSNLNSNNNTNQNTNTNTNTNNNANNNSNSNANGNTNTLNPRP